MQTWVFLRGLTREAAHWGTFARTFEQALPGARVLALDLPGNGQLHHAISPLTVQAMAQAGRAELARRGIPPPYHCLAMSLGAMVAIEWARIAPSEVAGCVLINTSVRPFSRFDERLRPRNYAQLLRLMLLRPPPEAIERTVWALTSNQPEMQAETVADWVATRANRPVSASNAVRQLLAAARYRAPASAPTRNLLLLASKEDRLVSVRCSEALARAWGSALVQHPWAGHDLPLDDPQWVAAQVRRWMTNPSAGGAGAGN